MPMRVVQLDRAIDRGMIHDAARVGLVGVGAQVEIDAEPCRDLREVVGRRLDRREAARTFDAVHARREAFLGEQRRGVAVLCRTSGVERLRHRAEHLAQTRGLCRRQPDGPDHFLHRQFHQPADRGRGPEHAGGAGDVPARHRSERDRRRWPRATPPRSRG